MRHVEQNFCCAPVALPLTFPFASNVDDVHCEKSALEFIAVRAKEIVASALLVNSMSKLFLLSWQQTVLIFKLLLWVACGIYSRPVSQRDWLLPIARHGHKFGWLEYLLLNARYSYEMQRHILSKQLILTKSCARIYFGKNLKGREPPDIGGRSCN